MVRSYSAKERRPHHRPPSASGSRQVAAPRTTNETDVAAHGSGRSFVLLKGAGGKACCAGGDMRLVHDATLEAAFGLAEEVGVEIWEVRRAWLTHPIPSP